MIDLHTHILPFMDDGSKSPDESLAMIRKLRSQGVKHIFATPHFYAHREGPGDFLHRRQESLAYLGEDAQELILGAEVAYFSGMSKCIDLQTMTLGNTNLLLVEMPFTPWSNRVLWDIYDISANLGLIPVLAHVNRYRKAHQFPQYHRSLFYHDALFQCNCEAFEGFWCRQWALKTFNQGMIHFLGSDCHNMDKRPPNFELAMKFLEKKLPRYKLENFQNQAKELLKIEE